MPRDWIILFIALPLAACVLCLATTGRLRAQRWIGIVALTANGALAAWAIATVFRGADQPGRILVSHIGGWPAPFGIALALDTLSALMILVAAVVALCAFVFCAAQLSNHLQGGFFHPVFHALILGVQWSLLTGDLFNLFVGFEIMLTASYVLLVNGTTRAQMRHAYKYVLLNLLSSLIFVTCCGLIYGRLGTLNLADLARLTREGLMPAHALPFFATLLIAFGVKSAIFPLWFWLPDTYPTLHPAVGGLFAGLLTKVGAYVVIRIFVMTVGAPQAVIGSNLARVVLISAGVTMLLGVLGAVAMQSVRRILSIHVISQVGYMILGAGIGMAAGISADVRTLAVAGAIFFIVHNMVVKTSLFLCGGLMRNYSPGGTDDTLDSLGGLARRAPWLAAVFFVAALSLAGLPPFSGFFAKWMLLRATFMSGLWVLAATAILTSLFTLLSMLKIWSYGFWSTPPSDGPGGDGPLDARGHPRWRRNHRIALLATATLVLVALTMGLGAGAYYDVTMVAARSIIDPDAYIRAVLPDDALRIAPAIAPPVGRIEAAPVEDSP